MNRRGKGRENNSDMSEAGHELQRTRCAREEAERGKVKEVSADLNERQRQVCIGEASDRGGSYTRRG